MTIYYRRNRIDPPDDPTRTPEQEAFINLLNDEVIIKLPCCNIAGSDDHFPLCSFAQLADILGCYDIYQAANERAAIEAANCEHAFESVPGALTNYNPFKCSKCGVEGYMNDGGDIVTFGGRPDATVSEECTGKYMYLYPPVRLCTPEAPCKFHKCTESAGPCTCEGECIGECADGFNECNCPL